MVWFRHFYFFMPYLLTVPYMLLLGYESSNKSYTPLAIKLNKRAEFIITQLEILVECHVNYLQGSTLKKEDTIGLAVFLCYLCTNNNTMVPVLLTGINRSAEKSVPEVFTVI